MLTSTASWEKPLHWKFFMMVKGSIFHLLTLHKKAVVCTHWDFPVRREIWNSHEIFCFIFVKFLLFIANSILILPFVKNQHLLLHSAIDPHIHGKYLHIQFIYVHNEWSSGGGRKKFLWFTHETARRKEELRKLTQCLHRLRHGAKGNARQEEKTFLCTLVKGTFGENVLVWWNVN